MVSNRSIRVSSKDESKALVMQALNNTPGAARDIVAYNAGLAIYAGNRASSMAEGINAAFELLASGAARDKLEQFCALTRKLAK
jgi:anthranilate phosphoribosyltransferase